MNWKEKMLERLMTVTPFVLREIGILKIEIEREYPFMHSRNWRFDYAIPSLKIALEYQGGVFMKSKSGHSNIAGQTRDWEKFNEAQVRGWIVICANPKTIQNGSFENQIKRAIQVRAKKIRYE